MRSFQPLALLTLCRHRITSLYYVCWHMRSNNMPRLSVFTLNSITFRLLSCAQSQRPEQRWRPVRRQSAQIIQCITSSTSTTRYKCCWIFFTNFLQFLFPPKVVVVVVLVQVCRSPASLHIPTYIVIIIYVFIENIHIFRTRNGGKRLNS